MSSDERLKNYIPPSLALSPVSWSPYPVLPQEWSTFHPVEKVSESWLH